MIVIADRTGITSRILNIQALRGFAAVLVALGHGLRVGVVPNWMFALISYVAYGGVDIFFVISGYIVTDAAVRASSKVKMLGGVYAALDFATRRIFRIYPLYWIVVILAESYHKKLNLTPDWWPSLSFFTTVTLTTMWTPLPSAWSLAFEVYFYSILTFIVLFFNQYLSVFVFIWMSIQIVLIIGGHYGFLKLQVISDPLVLEFALGWLVRVIHIKYTCRFFKASGISAILCFGLGGYLTSLHGLLGPEERFVTFGIGSACLLYALISAEERRWTAAKWSQKIGDVSYSIYMWHMLIFGFVYAAYPNPGPLEFWVTFLVLIAVSFLSYIIIEKPMIRLGSLVLRPTRWKSLRHRQAK